MAKSTKGPVKPKAEEKKLTPSQQIIKELTARLGKDTVRMASDTAPVFFVPYDIPSLDFICGGGIPLGRIIEHYGQESSTKSFSSLMAIASFQRTKFDLVGSKHELLIDPTSNLTPALVDVEGTYTSSWGEKIGIDNSNLLYADPESLEEAVDIAEVFLRDPSISLVVFDSLSAFGDKTEIENSMSKDQMSSTPRFWNKAVRKFQAAMAANPNRIVTLIVINSAYEKVGFSMGDSEVVKNGNQLRLAKSMSTRFNRLKLEKGSDALLNSEENVGFNVSITNKKNKVGRLGLKSSYYFSLIEQGNVKAGKIDEKAQTIELAVRFGLINKRGAWYDFAGKAYQGMANLTAAFDDEESMYFALKTDVYSEIRKFHE